MKCRICVLAALLALAGPGAWAAPGPSITGGWRGVLKVGPGVLVTVLHVSKAADGNYHATMDTVDQDAYGVPVTSITLAGPKLSFSIASIHGSYRGVVAAGGGSISGTWTQHGNGLPLDFTRLGKPSDLEGAWHGTLLVGSMKLPVVFIFITTQNRLTATMDSPSQARLGFLVTQILRQGSQLTLVVASNGGKFTGTLNQAKDAIAGAWTQNGHSLPLTLARVKNVAELQPAPPKRPQNPLGPLPYRHPDVTFENPRAGFKLAGTLTIPRGKGPFPAAVLIAGSGPHGRDETVAGHKPFLVLSDYLTRRGIEVLRYDKRGVGQSGGNYGAATTADFAGDAQAAFNFLRAQPGVSPRRVGLIGHSEGGEIAPMVAARDPHVAFVVMMAGPGVPGDQLLPEQYLLISEAMGTSPQRAEKEAAEEGKVLEMVKAGDSPAALEKRIREDRYWEIPEAQLGTEVRTLNSPWFRYFLSYDPATALEKVTCPVLVLSGEKDLQVPPQQNLPAIRKALQAAGNRHFEIDELPGLNHLFQPAKTGAPAEYAGIETTLAPAVLEKTADWILKE